MLVASLLHSRREHALVVDGVDHGGAKLDSNTHLRRGLRHVEDQGRVGQRVVAVGSSVGRALSRSKKS